MCPKNTPPAGASEDAKAPKFEQALEKLESLVADMESGRLNLDDMLKAFEEGQRLIRFCGRKLNEVERRIEAIVEHEDGHVSREPFDAEGEGDASARAED